MAAPRQGPPPTPLTLSLTLSLTLALALSLTRAPILTRWLKSYFLPEGLQVWVRARGRVSVWVNSCQKAQPDT